MMMMQKKQQAAKDTMYCIVHDGDNILMSYNTNKSRLHSFLAC